MSLGSHIGRPTSQGSPPIISGRHTSGEPHIPGGGRISSLSLGRNKRRVREAQVRTGAPHCCQEWAEWCPLDERTRHPLAQPSSEISLSMKPYRLFQYQTSWGLFGRCLAGLVLQCAGLFWWCWHHHFGRLRRLGHQEWPRPLEGMSGSLLSERLTTGEALGLGVPHCRAPPPWLKGGQRGTFAIFGEENTFGCNGRRFAVFAEWVECSFFFLLL